MGAVLRFAGPGGPPGSLSGGEQAGGDEDGADEEGVEQDADGDGDPDLGDGDRGELGEGGEGAGQDDAGGGDDASGDAEPAQDAVAGTQVPGFFLDAGGQEDAVVDAERDEPANGLDPEGIIWLRRLLRSLAAEGRTVLVSSHLMSEMSLTADHLIVIGRGRLIADTSVAEFVKASSIGVVSVRTPARDQP